MSYTLNIGVGKTFLLQSYIQKTDKIETLATNGVDYSEKLLIKDMICHRFIFSDFSGQERLSPIIEHYMKSIQSAVLVVDATDPYTVRYILFSKHE